MTDHPITPADIERMRIRPVPWRGALAVLAGVALFITLFLVTLALVSGDGIEATKITAVLLGFGLALAVVAWAFNPNGEHDV